MYLYRGGRCDNVSAWAPTSNAGFYRETRSTESNKFRVSTNLASVPFGTGNTASLRNSSA